LHILAITNTYPTKEKPGDSPQIRDQLEALKSRGVRVDVLYINRYQGAGSYAQAGLKIIAESIIAKQYDLLHAFYGHCGFLARLQIRYPVIVTFLGSDILHPRDGTIGKLAARYADGVIVQSEEMKRVAKRADAVIIPFGINTDLFTATPKAEARYALGLPPEKKLVLFPWNPARQVKRYDLIEVACEIVRQRWGDVELISIYDKSHEIVAKYMSACDAMVLASDHEGSPMALREAMACNLPIVSVDVGDVRQIIEKTEGCYLCRRDPSDIAEKLDLVFVGDKRTDGVQIVKQLDAAWGAEQVMNLYDRVLNSRASHRKGGTS
jgi:teichuronic acid biosynthesis glycosyltransferase TuaC